MIVEHHDLVHELPEHREKIHFMKMENAHFAKLFATYHEVNNSIEVLENNGSPVTDETLDEMKKQRLALKDELYAMLTA